MSLEVPAQVPTSKICTVCGLDVSGKKRTKDKRGRYYCASCWDEVVERHRQQQSAVAVADPAPAPGPELMPCEACGGQFVIDKLTMHNGRVVCDDCVSDGTADTITPPPLVYASPTTPSEKPSITATNYLMFATAILGILPPIGVPLQIWTALRLLKLANMEGQWGWVVGAGVPWIGLLVCKELANKAGAVVNRAPSNIKPFDRWEQERYKQLLTLNRVGYSLVIIPYFLGKIIFGQGDIGLFGIVGLLVCGYAKIQMRPFRKTLREAAGKNLWFTTDPVQSYENKLTGVGK